VTIHVYAATGDTSEQKAEALMRKTLPSSRPGVAG